MHWQIDLGYLGTLGETHKYTLVVDESVAGAYVEVIGPDSGQYSVDSPTLPKQVRELAAKELTALYEII